MKRFDRVIRRVGRWLKDALLDTPRYVQWAPYWSIGVACGALLNSEAVPTYVAGIALLVVGPPLAHLWRHAGGGSSATYRYGYTCACGSFKVSTTDQPTLVMLRDAHRSTCKAVRS